MASPQPTRDAMEMEGMVAQTMVIVFNLVSISLVQIDHE